MRRIPLGVVAVATLMLVACGEQSDHALGPQLPPRSVAADVAPCPTANGVDSLITTLFSGGNQTAALSKFSNIVALLDSTPPGEDTATAQAHTLDLLGFTLQKYEQGSLNGGTSSATQATLVALVNGLLCFSGLPATFSIGDLGPDGAFAIITTSTPDTTVVTGTLHAGVHLDSGSVTQTTLLTIQRLPDSPGPLLTQLDQYPLFYEFHVTPSAPFQIPVLVGACQPSTLDTSVVKRLRIAHNVAPYTPGSIEILPFAPANFLDCSNVSLGLRSTNPLANLAMAGWRAVTSLLAPARLLASTGGIGGTAKSFSPFGAVDTLVFMTPNSDTTQNAPVGGAVSSTPSVKIQTFQGRPIVGDPVAFAVTAGGGSLTGASTATDNTGVATAGSWTVGPTPGLNTVSATGTILYARSGIQPNPQNFSATGLPATQVVFKQQPSSTVAGTTMAPAVTVAVEDAVGQVVTSSAATVSLAVTQAGITLGGTTSVAAVNGIATFSNLTVTKAGTGYTLTAASAGLTSAVSTPFNVTAAAADTIFAVAGNNQTALAGTAVATPPAVRVTDQYLNPVSGVSVTFVAQNGGSVTGAVQTTDATGTATVGSWYLVAGTNYLLGETTTYFNGGTGLGGDPVTFTATGTTTLSTLVNCPPSNGAGDPLTNAFYDPKYQGRSLSEVQLYLGVNGQSNAPTPYTIQLIAKSGGYNGPVIGTSTVTVYLRGSASQNLPTNFVFAGSPAVSKNSTVTFQFNVLSIGGSSLRFNVGSCGVGNTSCKTSCPIVETTDASGTLSTFYRKGCGVTILGGS